ncbi:MULTISPECIES: DNA translocase FtsK [unclassified Acinetobacter]|uniref:DNA translocase FtsK n=1 Tax=unclassified Acinetobacter TaxID=196816 RepID=UPI0029351033|nr:MULTISPECIES: DNA translocase FtsK 4TM domain-containing protein [unclassified Acinetobacter]WOE32998.1 DNA translocase FtsK 4TM domain-containing protein [Acinetobacter sp. SAAs470]WOE38476.1 DNA translocase FtsK 4TM domain-containing protein [Acinetobacter sp. SAAs474]
MTAVSSTYVQRLIVTIFLISFGIYLFLATVTYTPFDPGWMHLSSDTQTVSNASGVIGAWIADLLFGFLGWAMFLVPIYLFTEAIQLWWPHSFLNRSFRYAAQFFIVLATSSLLYLFWQVPSDTLANASGGIIGYELGQSLTQVLTIYGASLFLIIFWLILFTLAFGVKWNKTWSTLKATPAYLQDLFYHVPKTQQQATTHTTPIVQTTTIASAPRREEMVNQNELTESIQLDTAQQEQPVDHTAERLFNDIVAKENHQRDQQQLDDSAKVSVQHIEQAHHIELEQTIAQAHQVEQEIANRVVSTGEVWRAIADDAVQQHNQDIHALLKASQDHQQPSTLDPMSNHGIDMTEKMQTSDQSEQQRVDWDDDQIFDELLAAVPHHKSVDMHRPFQQQTHDPHHGLYIVEDTPVADQEMITTASRQPSADGLRPAAAPLSDVDFDHLDQLLMDDIAETTTKTAAQVASYAQSTPFVNAAIHTATSAAPLVSSDEKERIRQDKDAFREAWQDTTATAAAPLEEEFDLDAPLTDRYGRPLSRAMQVAQKRKDLPTLPGLEILDKVDPNKKVNFTAEQLARLSELLEIKLQEFNVKAKVIEAQPGPVVTRFELDLAPGVKASKVTNISRDLARSMSMASVRVVEVIPGKPYIGIEVPNSSREMVRLIELLDTPTYRDPNALISMAMGKDISGHPVLTDLAKAPHMLVAGTTGSGKSVAVNAMILSMLLKYTPEQLRLIMIDPKQLELANYNDIPHLLTPVVTDMKDAVSALNWCVNEMERRYKLMSLLKIRKLADYNRKVEEAIENGEDLIDPTWKPSDSATQSRAPRLTPLPTIVIIADEFADMIMQVGKKAEEMITRLAQKSRAAGIHLLLATQRPTVDVVTGLIKANIPTRVALRVNSKLDSRTILDAGGAEDLLGHGDMLFLGPGKIEPERVHGAFISDDEVNRICDAWRERGEPNYIDEILTPYDEEQSSRGFEDADGASDRDALYDQCVAFVLETRKASTSSLQRKFSLGYNRAARIIDQMEESGIVSAMGANGKREILV